MPIITTPFGPIDALPRAEFYPDGSVRSCTPACACPLDTPLGTLIPQFTANTLRKRQLPVIFFHPNGTLRTLPLEERTVVPSPAGPIAAEQVTFHDCGALKRLFPLNGKLSGYWTQRDEETLAEPIGLETPLGPVEALIIGLCFNRQGGVRSLTLWPGQTLDVPCPQGTIEARIGVSFFDSGAISSLEPARPVHVSTPLGKLLAYDPDAIGICGDGNSLRFRENGSLLGLRTTANAFDVVQENGRVRRISPPLRRDPCEGVRVEAAPLALEFGSGRVWFPLPGGGRVSAAVGDVTALPFHPPLPALNAACSMGSGRW